MSYWHQLVGPRSAQVLVHLSNSLWGFTSLKPWEWTWKFLMRCRPGLTLTGRFESLKGQLIDCSSHSHTLSTFWKIVFKEFNKMMRINHEKAAEVSCCSTGGCSTVQHSTVQYSSILYCTTRSMCVSPHQLSVLMLLIKRFKPIWNGISWKGLLSGAGGMFSDKGNPH